MIELRITLQEYMARAAILHPCICPRQIIGLRMARLACRWLEIDPAVQRKQIFVYMEMGRCAADSVILVTGASPTNQLMRLMNFGKLAATFVSLNSGRAIRVSEHFHSRQTAANMLPEYSNVREAQIRAYQYMSDELLLYWQEVNLLQGVPIIPEKYSIDCSRCGERINENAHLTIANRPVCKPCTEGTYYSAIELVESQLY
jgi:formylmethanofuran dehydrogenase subunit E